MIIRVVVDAEYALVTSPAMTRTIFSPPTEDGSIGLLTSRFRQTPRVLDVAKCREHLLVLSIDGFFFLQAKHLDEVSMGTRHDHKRNHRRRELGFRATDIF